MWDWTFDAAAGHACALYKGLAGHYPGSCLVDAGRPFLVAVTAVAAVAAVVAILVWRRLRSA